MRIFRAQALGSAALGLVLAATAAPAMAQMAGGGMGAGVNGKAPAPLTRTPDIAPPAIPGAPVPAVATGPVLQKPITGDPTAALFTAIIKGDDSAAQAALGSGADLSAQNQFGETPLDLAIALNRTSITFLLLQTRNELAAQGKGPDVMGAPWTLNGPLPPLTNEKTAYKPPAATHKPKPAPNLPSNIGTPDPNAGFLGFGPKS